MKDLTSIDVGHESWQGACAHLRHRRASRTAARSPPRNELGFTSVHHRFQKPPAESATTPLVSCTDDQNKLRQYIRETLNFVFFVFERGVFVPRFRSFDTRIMYVLYLGVRRVSLVMPTIPNRDYRRFDYGPGPSQSGSSRRTVAIVNVGPSATGQRFGVQPQKFL